jgi:hypothetical protein
MSGVGGIGDSQTNFEIPVPDLEEEAEAQNASATKSSAEGEAVVPESARTVDDAGLLQLQAAPGAALLESELSLVDPFAGAEVIEVDEVDAATEVELQERIAWLEEELEWLYEEEDYLWDLVYDPSTDFFDSIWIEYDAWDVGFEIEDLEAELADLKGEVYERTTAEGFSGFVGVLPDIMKLFAANQGLKLELFDQKLKDAQKEFERLRRLRGKDRGRESNVDRRKTIAASHGKSTPPFTADQMEILRAKQSKLEGLARDPTPERVQEVRDELRQLRGERPRLRP